MYCLLLNSLICTLRMASELFIFLYVCIRHMHTNNDEVIEVILLKILYCGAIIAKKLILIH